MPPGKKWPIFRVRTTASTRTVEPGAKHRLRVSSGAATLPTSRISTGAALLRFLADREGRHQLRAAQRCGGASRVWPFASSTGEAANMSTVMKPDFRNFSVSLFCA